MIADSHTQNDCVQRLQINTVIMKNEILEIADKLKLNEITPSTAQKQLLCLFGVIKSLPFQGITWELYDKLHTEAINKRKAELKGNVL